MNIDFSISGYRNLLAHFQKYLFDISTFDKANFDLERLLILRHDVDFDLNEARKMAIYEEQFGVRSTYFVMLQSEFYNALTLESISIIREIADCGHEIGLHWDRRALSSNPEKAVEELRALRTILEEISEYRVVSASQHSPTRDLDTLDIQEVFDIDAYSRRFMIDTKYISDSSMVFREIDAIEDCVNYRRIQLLIHPIWWTVNGSSREEKLADLIKNKINRINADFNRNETLTKNVLSSRLSIDEQVRSIFKFRKN